MRLFGLVSSLLAVALFVEWLLNGRHNPNRRPAWQTFGGRIQQAWTGDDHD